MKSCRFSYKSLCRFPPNSWQRSVPCACSYSSVTVVSPRIFLLRPSSKHACRLQGRRNRQLAIRVLSIWTFSAYLHINTCIYNLNWLLREWHSCVVLVHKQTFWQIFGSRAHCMSRLFQTLAYTLMVVWCCIAGLLPMRLARTYVWSARLLLVWLSCVVLVHKQTYWQILSSHAHCISMLFHTLAYTLLVVWCCIAGLLHIGLLRAYALKCIVASEIGQ